MRTRSIWMAIYGLAVIPMAAQADIVVAFTESAPRDRFEIINTNDCTVGPVTLSIDLKSSAGKLVFDTARGGSGVEVFQPLEFFAGESLLTAPTDLSDGADYLMISFTALEHRQMIGFTTDVDDQLSNSQMGQIRVSGSEIKGASVSVMQQDQVIASALFDGDSLAEIPFDSCGVS